MGPHWRANSLQLSRAHLAAPRRTRSYACAHLSNHYLHQTFRFYPEFLASNLAAGVRLTTFSTFSEDILRSSLLDVLNIMHYIICI